MKSLDLTHYLDRTADILSSPAAKEVDLRMALLLKDASSEIKRLGILVQYWAEKAKYNHWWKAERET